MRILINTIICLSALLALMSGINDFSEYIYFLIAGILYLIARYFKYYDNYRQWKVSTRSKPFLSRFIPNIFRAFIFVLIYSLIGYGFLLISKTDFYVAYFQSFIQSALKITDEIITFWINVPYQLMKYGH